MKRRIVKAGKCLQISEFGEQILCGIKTEMIKKASC